MEKELFSWKGMIGSYNVVLKVKIDKYQSEGTISSNFIYYLNTGLSFYLNINDEEPERIFKFLVRCW